MLTQKRLLGFMLRIGAALAISIMASPAISAPIEWVTVGSPNVTKDDTGYGAVGYEFQMAKYETTNAQYVEFLNAVASKEDVHGLYSATMTNSVHGGIERQGGLGSYSYTAKAGMDNKPVNFVSFYDALRFSNWLDNGQGAGDTETGAYTLAGGNPVGVVRNAGASIFLPTENEWYKSAYYDAATASFFEYPTSSDAAPSCPLPGLSANAVNCSNGQGLYEVGSFPNSASPYGTLDQGGGLFEWVEAGGPVQAVLRGGGYLQTAAYYPSASSGAYAPPSGLREYASAGFRIASWVPVPEPNTGLLVLGGMLALSGWRRTVR